MFGFCKKSFQERRTAILSCFQDAAKSLEELNEEAYKELDQLDSDICRLSQERASLVSLAECNEKTIRQLSNFC